VLQVDKLLKGRSVWMGIAIIWIIFYHYKLNVNNALLSNILGSGYGGCDIFAFASGVGVYYSFTRDYSISDFYKRRVNRLIPVYAVFMVFWLPYIIIKDQIPFSAIIGNLLGIQVITGSGYEFNWYTSFIVISYVLTPIFVEYIDRIGKNHIKMVLTLILLLVITIPFWNARNLIIIATRIPIFVLGLYVGKLGKLRYTFGLIDTAVICVSSIIGVICLEICFDKYSNLLWNYGLYWYPFLLITPGLCYVISMITIGLERFKLGEIIIKIITTIGGASFEVYLTHIFVLDLYKVIFEDPDTFKNSNRGIFTTLISVVLLTIFLQIVSKGVRKITNIVMNIPKRDQSESSR
jgi:peptidoglycan/LPS O-acetylase OafA/YrhL